MRKWPTHRTLLDKPALQHKIRGLLRPDTINFIYLVPMSNMYSDLNRFIEKLTVKSLHNLEMEVITTGYMGSKTKPRLIMRFSPGSYDLRSIQGFIQNVEVKKIKEIIKNGVLKLTLRPATDLKRRRTLFTVTARDSNGQWYWFSYLFVLLELDE